MVGECSRLEEEIYKRIHLLLSGRRGNLLTAANVYRLKHGRRWKTMHSSDPEEAAESKLRSTEISIDLRRVIDNDVNVLIEFIARFSEQLHGMFMQTMFEMLEETIQKSGNQVDGRQGFKAGFEEALTGIAFGVDRYGVPTNPQLVVGSGIAKQIQRLSMENDPEYKARIEAITECKEADATAKEACRISNYKIALKR
jgi:hypothetical protein